MILLWHLALVRSDRKQISQYGTGPGNNGHDMSSSRGEPRITLSACEDAIDPGGKLARRSLGDDLSPRIATYLSIMLMAGIPMVLKIIREEI
jgi:hypothetical protein